MIRPIDLQNSILSNQGAVAVQRAQEGPRLDAQAAQAAFAAELVHRDETVAPATEVLGNRVGAKPHGGEHPGEKRQRHPAAETPFEQLVDDAAGLSEEAPHIVDLTA
jgi:hypothetical protein